MIQRRGDVFTTESPYIGHGVNLSGVMGKGIALTIRERFPESFNQYADACAKQQLELGGVLITVENEKVLLHMATQRWPGPDARYDAIFDSAMDAAEQVSALAAEQERSPVLAIPRIGAGIGGLEWDKVQSLLLAVEILNPGFQFEVWTL